MTNTNDILHRILAISEGASHQSQHALSLSGQAIALASALDQIEELIASHIAESADETSDANGAADPTAEANDEASFSDLPDFEALFQDLIGGRGEDDNPVRVFLGNLPQSAEQIKDLLDGKLPTEEQINEKLKDLGLDKLIEKGLGFGFGFVPDSK